MIFYVNSLFVLLVVVEAGKTAIHCFNPKPLAITTERVAFSSVTTPERPDIYFFVLDEYAGSQSLKENSHFDNSVFENALRKRKFFVAATPNSNYNGTSYSLMSLLNMGYLKNITDDDISTASGYGETVKGIQHNQLTAFFRKNGYSIINNSFFRIDSTLSKPVLFLPVDSRLALDKTLWHVLLNNLCLQLPSNKLQFFLNTYNAKIDNYNQRTIKTLNESITMQANPVFIYSHLVMPHSPYLRDVNGRLRSLADAQKELNLNNGDAAYIDYLRYTNGIVLKAVDDILFKKPSSIIVIISDHGNRLSKKEGNSESDFNNIISVYFPEHNYADFTNEACLVNLFRIILNNRFNQKLPMLKNSKVNVEKSPL